MANGELGRIKFIIRLITHRFPKSQPLTDSPPLPAEAAAVVGAARTTATGTAVLAATHEAEAAAAAAAAGPSDKSTRAKRPSGMAAALSPPRLGGCFCLALLPKPRPPETLALPMRRGSPLFCRLTRGCGASLPNSKSGLLSLYSSRPRRSKHVDERFMLLWVGWGGWWSPWGGKHMVYGSQSLTSLRVHSFVTPQPISDQSMTDMQVEHRRGGALARVWGETYDKRGQSRKGEGDKTASAAHSL